MLINLSNLNNLKTAPEESLRGKDASRRDPIGRDAKNCNLRY